MRAVTERDVDVWLAEELRVNPRFAGWFLQSVAPRQDASLPAIRTNVSAVSEYGETDVEVLFELNSGGRLGLLVENKIGHTITDEQLGRYDERGNYGVANGLWQSFVVAVFAPDSILARHVTALVGRPSISFESAAKFLVSSASDPRSIYRAEFIQAASMKESIGSLAADAERVLFWTQFYKLAEEEHKGVFAFKLNNYPKTAFIAANPPNAPKYLRLDLKGGMGEIDITFTNMQPGRLITLLEERKPGHTKLAFNKGSIALRVDRLKRFRVADGFERSRAAMLEALNVADGLVKFWSSNRADIDRLTVEK